MNPSRVISLTLPCPYCGTLSPWQDNIYRPFCSERCKLIDLGAWANEDYRITDQSEDPMDTDQAILD